MNESDNARDSSASERHDLVSAAAASMSGPLCAAATASAIGQFARFLFSKASRFVQIARLEADFARPSSVATAVKATEPKT